MIKINKYVIIFVLLICYFIYYFYTNNNKTTCGEKYTDNINRYVKKIYPKTDEKFLFQTYNDKSKIPQDVYDNVKKFAPEYTHIILDDNDIIDFLKEFYNEEILNTFNNLNLGAHKADFARYCLLYIYGGLYIDVKTELVKPIKDIFTDSNIIYSVISSHNDHIYQGIIHTPQNKEIFLGLIHYMVVTQNPPNYLSFCRDFYAKIKDDVGYIKTGFLKGKKNDYYLFREMCNKDDASMCYDGFDRYHLCCFVMDGDKPIIKVRRSSYPW
jgi:hypothetical protein